MKQGTEKKGYALNKEDYLGHGHCMASRKINRAKSSKLDCGTGPRRREIGAVLSLAIEFATRNDSSPSESCGTLVLGLGVSCFNVL